MKENSESPQKQCSHFKPTKIGVFLPSALTESFEIVLARVADLHKVNENVEIIQCDGEVKGCVANPFNIKSTCNHCKKVRDSAIEHLGLSCERISVNNKNSENYSLENGFSEKLLKNIKAGVDSTVLTFYRRKKISFNKYDIRRLLISRLERNLFEYSKTIYAESQSVLRNRKISRLEFFNGRIVPNYALLQSAVDFGLDFSIIEVAGITRSILTVKNNSIHDLNYRQSALREFISSGLSQEDQGVRFFESRRAGQRTDTISFVNHQKEGMIKETEKPILAVFMSSTDEFEFLGDQWFTEASKNPHIFIRALNELIKDDYRIVVRMHPNQAGDYTGAAKYLEKQLREVSLVEVIGPRDQQSTYELIDKASVVLTFGSSVGIEATYAKKPSILVGRAVWEFLDIAYHVETPEEVSELLKKSIKAKPQADALRVASYYMIGDGVEGTLTWDKDKQLFYVDGHSFLNNKRSSIGYYIPRFFDKLLRLP
ncbi:capsular polysaccharide export protein, LipB/KpsS family [Marinobacter sp. NSM]|uniref:capsular polysaccharide export protein, LipB/KpsS family n=1 Tax=Marinobacter sp. NSM TaxID=3458004 RepID=UPI004035B630